MTTATETFVTLPKNTNQALGIGNFAIDFFNKSIGKPSQSVLDRTRLFFTDAVLCGLSALSVKTNAPVVLRNEALEYVSEKGATVFGSNTLGSTREGYFGELLLRCVSGIQTELILVLIQILGTRLGSLGTTIFMRYPLPLHN